MRRRGLIISGMRGGSGKTVVSIGLTAALRRRGFRIAAFKKGPDYIDAGWLSLAAGRPCHNLDTYLVDPPVVVSSFLKHSQSDEIAVVEGNRGLYDGIDLAGATSTAELAKLLDLPVLLSIDCTKTTRTLAAAVSGLIAFDRDIDIAAVVLNRVAGDRHRRIITQSIHHYCDIPVVGAIPKLGRQDFPERHMGLIPIFEHDLADESVEAARKVIEARLDIPSLLDILDDRYAKRSTAPYHEVETEWICIDPEPRPKIGVIRDSAFQFYYPENIEALVSAGADLVFISPLTDQAFPELDGLYIGGGFPETHADKLSENQAFRRGIKERIEAGMPVYAECGGLMYLCESLLLNETYYPMIGVMPAVLGLSKKPSGHGYTLVAVEGDNPFYAIGTEFRGHEFHYSHVLDWKGNASDLVFSMRRGAGIIDGRDGFRYKNVLATYTHIHALGIPNWACALVESAFRFHTGKTSR